MKQLSPNIESQIQIYTTGAFLKPIKIIDSEKKEVWIWYVSEFTDDSFTEGKTFNPPENAETLNKLVSELS